MHVHHFLTLERKDNFRLFFFAALVGVIAGLVAVLYRYAVTWAELFRNAAIYDLDQPKVVFAYFAALVLIAFCVWKLLEVEPEIKGGGIPQVQRLVHENQHPKWARVLVAKFIGGALCILGGLSLGRAGPSIQLSATVGQGFSEVTRQRQETARYLIGCGACAGLAAAFNAPLAGVMFALEEIHRNFTGRAVFPAMLSAICADLVSKAFFGVNASLRMNFAGEIPYKAYLYFIIMGLLLGLLSTLYNKMVPLGKKLYRKLKKWPFLRILIPFLTAGVLALTLPEVLGSGQSLIAGTVIQRFDVQFLLLLLAAKFLFTLISFCSGAPGGTFFPVLAMGALAGALLGNGAMLLLGLPSEYLLYCILMGMGGMFAGVVRAPLTGILLVVEMSGALSQLAGITVVVCTSCLTGILLKNQAYYQEDEDQENGKVRA